MESVFLEHASQWFVILAVYGGLAVLATMILGFILWFAVTIFRLLWTPKPPPEQPFLYR